MNLAQHGLVAALRLYRWTLSPLKTALFGPLARCRYTPSCSAYALEAVVTHGAGRGSWLAMKRLGRCHPWGGCGHEPVPPRVSRADAGHSSRMIDAGASSAPALGLRHPRPLF